MKREIAIPPTSAELVEKSASPSNVMLAKDVSIAPKRYRGQDSEPIQHNIATELARSPL